MAILNSVVFPWKIIQPQDVSSAWELKAYESYALHYPVIFRDYSLWHQTCLLSWMHVIFHCPLEDSLIQPFPAGSWPLPFPRTLGKFRIGPHLAGEWTGKVKLEAVLYWEYSVYRKSGEWLIAASQPLWRLCCFIWKLCLGTVLGRVSHWFLVSKSEHSWKVLLMRPNWHSWDKERI